VFSESDRVAIREFMGFSAIFLQAEPLLENAITAIQAVADGGTRPDQSSETRVKAIIQSLQAVEDAIDGILTANTLGFAFTTKADEAALDCAMGLGLLRQRGRQYVTRLANILATKPRSDCFSPTRARPDGVRNLTD
jgi:hypothetical protein